MPFSHRRLVVYQRAVAFVVETFETTGRITLRWRGVVDQVRRSAVSIPLNVAEGVSEPGGREQSRFLRIARRSAAACDAGYHILLAAGVIPAATAAQAETNLNQIAAMLTAMIRHSDARAHDRPRK